MTLPRGRQTDQSRCHPDSSWYALSVARASGRLVVAATIEACAPSRLQDISPIELRRALRPFVQGAVRQDLRPALIETRVRIAVSALFFDGRPGCTGDASAILYPWTSGLSSHLIRFSDTIHGWTLSGESSHCEEPSSLSPPPHLADFSSLRVFNRYVS